MESTSKRSFRSGKEYDHLIPRPGFIEHTVKRGATVADTVKFIPKAVRQTAWQTKKLTDTMFRGYDRREACRRIWQFLYDHIPYKKDEEGREQIRSPRFSWYHRHQRGIDCDCYTTFISTILYNLGIPHLLRIARYKEAHFEHIYPIVPMPDGSYLTIDCVVSRFNYEEPYTEIKDTHMDLEFLDGIPEGSDLFGMEDLEGLEGKFRPGKILKKGLHSFNRVNPATIALRNGLLAAMKLNTMNIAGRLKWSYLTEQQAIAKGINPVKHRKLRLVRERLEKIFHGAGGKEKNLKAAILKGKGNRGAAVHGLGYIDPQDIQGLDGMDENTPLRQLLGPELWDSENVQGIDGLDNLNDHTDLGQLAAAVAISTTTAALTTVSELLKKIGDIFPNRQAAPAEASPEASPAEDLPTAMPTPRQSSPAETEEGSLPPDAGSEESTPDEPAADQTETGTETEELSGSGKVAEFFKRRKHWIKPALWSAGGLTLLLLSYRALTSDKKEKQERKAPSKLSGLPGKRKKKAAARAKRKKAKQPLELM